jgi:hypothetical protein
MLPCTSCGYLWCTSSGGRTCCGPKHASSPSQGSCDSVGQTSGQTLHPGVGSEQSILCGLVWLGCDICGQGWTLLIYQTTDVPTTTKEIQLDLHIRSASLVPTQT